MFMQIKLLLYVFLNELVLNGEYGLNGLPCHDNADKSYRNGIETEIIWNFN